MAEMADFPGSVVNLNRLRHFSVLADTLNFRIAAEQAHLTQPALTRSIANLEHELGVILFTRDKRTVALTADGSELLEPARSLLRDGHAFARTASALSAGGHQTLRVGVYGTALAELTYPVLQAFQERHPDVTVTVSDVRWDRGIEPLLRDELDVALLKSPADVASLTTVPLFTEPVSIQVSETHRLGRERHVDVEDLDDENWVGLPSATPLAWSRYWVCADYVPGQPRIGGTGMTMSEVAMLVALKQLIALVPRSATRQAYPGVHHTDVHGVEPFRVAVAWSQVAPNALIESFVETAIEVTRRKLAFTEGRDSLV